MQEIWQKFTPIEGIAEKYDLIRLNNLQGVSPIVILANTAHPADKLYLTFEADLISYSKTKRSFKSALFEDLDSRHGKYFVTSWSLFSITNSHYVELVSKHSLDFFRVKDMQHYVILTPHYLFDFITYQPPRASFSSLVE